jgi:beta-galactosidase/beta-glucuronidase
MIRLNLSLCLLLSYLFSAADGQAQTWQPAANPIMTRWAKEVSPANVWPEYPRPQMVRESWLNLNGLWEYAVVGKEVERPQAWQGRLLVPFPIESALSGVKQGVTPDQRLWYRRTFTIPAAWRGERVILHFGAVDWECSVRVNGKEVGQHRGGYDPFSFDVTEALRAEGEQVLELAVWDPTDTGSQPRGKQQLKPEGIWYTPVTGIWQTVWLEPVPAVSIARLKLTPDIDRETLSIDVVLRGPAEGCEIVATAGPKAQHVATAKRAAGKTLTLNIDHPKLWSPDLPFLYDLTVEIHRAGRPVDRVESYFGMRKSSLGQVNGTARMMLNNRPLFQLGPLDQGWWPDGLYTPPSEAAMANDLDVLKKLGFNMLRKHVKVEPARYYYLCDRLGLLVWQDMPSGMATHKPEKIRREGPEDVTLAPEDEAQFQHELRAVIDALVSAPSIVVWVPFNEGWGQHDTNTVLRWVEEYDPTRLVGGPSGWEDRGYGHLKDMHRYPGPAMFPPLGHRATVLGEFGGLGLPMEGHLWWTDKKNWGYQTFQSQEALQKRYGELIEQLVPLVGQGLSAAIYTQTSDVEGEVNGLLTFDREVVKFNPQTLAEWHSRLYRQEGGERAARNR